MLCALRTNVEQKASSHDCGVHYEATAEKGQLAEVGNHYDHSNQSTRKFTNIGTKQFATDIKANFIDSRYSANTRGTVD